MFWSPRLVCLLPIQELFNVIELFNAGQQNPKGARGRETIRSRYKSHSCYMDHRKTPGWIFPGPMKFEWKIKTMLVTKKVLNRFGCLKCLKPQKYYRYLYSKHRKRILS